MKIRIYHDPGEKREADLIATFAHGLSPDSDVRAVGTESHSELYQGIIENLERMDERSLRLAYWSTLELSKGSESHKKEATAAKYVRDKTAAIRYVLPQT